MINFYRKKNLMDLNPSLKWQYFRLTLHWISLPFKVLFNFINGSFIIIKNNLNFKIRSTIFNASLELKQQYFNKILNSLPILRTEAFKLYASGVPLKKIPDGYNHDNNRQLINQGILQFLFGQLNVIDEGLVSGTSLLISEYTLGLGIKLNPIDNTLITNVLSSNIECLSSLNIAMLSNQVKYNTILEDSYINTTRGEDIFRERYERLVVNIIEHNDMSLLEGASPVDKFALKLYKEKLSELNGNSDYLLMKSHKSIMSPGIELTGKNALSLLAAVRIVEKKLKKRSWIKLYNSLIWKQGYGLLSLFSSSNSNENHLSRMTDLYVLSKLSDSPAGRYFWKCAMKFTWLLTKHTYNGFYTGLLEKAHPNSVNQDYINKCINFLCEEEPRNFSYGNTVSHNTKIYPIKFNKQNDLGQKFNNNDEVFVDIESERTRNGLEFLANLIMLERNPRTLIEKK